MNPRANDSTNSEVILEFNSVSKTYDGKQNAVNQLTLAVRNGEFLTILGPSGSGKTTILMMLAGFEHPTEGDIRLEGKSLRRTPPFRRNIGLVFQNFALFPHKTVAENIAFPLRRRRLPKADIQGKIKSILKLVELEGFENRRPNQLSGGQQQRVALARALVFEPSLVLMDEPLGSLDRKLREQMQHELKRIHNNSGTTFVYVTHDQDEALAMSDRIVILKDGRLQQIGTPQAVYEQPKNLFVASFIGENNMLTGLVRHINGTTCSVELNQGPLIQAKRNGIKKTGHPTLVCIRPESLSIGGPVDDTSNRLTGTVGGLTYFGDHTRLRVDVPGQGQILAKIKHPAKDEALRPGSAVELNWNNCHCISLQESALSLDHQSNEESR
jgi:putative spermidine/putrescine transport system ATP-binding protein